MIDIIVPTYQRPERLARVRRNITDNTRAQHRVVFVPEPDDEATLAELERIGADYVVNARSRNYAGAINTAVLASDAEWVFAAADDLNFHPGWDAALWAVVDDWFHLYGTNDLGNPYVLAGTHATHYLVRRAYVMETGGTLTDGPGILMPECYTHNFTDTELIGVAKARVRFRPCLESVVEHLHHEFGKSENDSTYAKGREHLFDDEALYRERKLAWDNLSR